ncbi:MBL fold metallo-hydrolase [Pedobacter sp. Leaf194]|uniref:MBL fold metallo-hydrolase n=1 Tax=Pedobacter sp. Leaf194 TaxID=1736297 RepID=UPI0007036825|nr:MBL fold metallo-hydrolase [Pedobacter sp. Leaf194]KQS36903.1 MBL fold metallo-hydrolase [Pedobacter sp. Leaf194]
MKVTFLGTGTSQGVPVIACNCEVCTSGDKKNNRLRTSILIQTDDKNIVIDSGPDFRYQLLREKVKDLDAVLFTHEHKDHIAGLDDIRPFNYLLHKVIDVYATERVQTALKREFYYIFADTKYHGLPQIKLHTIYNGDAFTIGENTILPFEVMHHLLPITGYRIGDFTYITDAKTVSDASFNVIKGSRILVINALQNEPHISHFTLNEAKAFAEKVGAETTYLTHISHNLGLHNEVENNLPSNIRLAYDGLKIEL